MRMLFAFFILLAWTEVPFADNSLGEGMAAYKRQDYAKALEIIKPMAEKGDAEAQKMLGIMYGLGHGVEQNEPEALEWLTLAARGGNVESQEAVAAVAIREFHEKRERVEGKQEKIRWITASAERGNAEAMNMLGMLYSSGNGLPMTTIEAEKWYCRAIQKGHERAASNLGLMMAGTIYYMERVKKMGDSLPPPCSDTK